MSAPISLALVIHNHQPIGNFGWVVEDVYQKAYEPMIGALERHPRVRAALHYSGPLLEWLAANHEDAIARLRSLVGRGQVEILGGALYEPILAALPERDRLDQLVRMRDEIERIFETEPTGAWLAERVWEPSVPFDLAEAGYAYTVLDDNHLRAASIADDEMWGAYTTDDQGRSLTVFGTEQGLRYRIPWRPVEELIVYLRDAADAARPGEHRLGVMGDDGEKFGAWPGTYELCWAKEEWVERCFSALAGNADWLHTVTPSDWLAQEKPLGRIYVPTSSYVEMTEWALPPDAARTFHALIDDAAKKGSPAVPFLRGGFWRNFQARYREVNDLHKQMLRASAAVEAMPAGPVRERALDHLYRGQSNDCYWHGLFGGVYIVHMRMATLAELIAAEDLAAADAAVAGVADHDLDGLEEVLLGTRGQTVLVDVAEGAGIGSWDLRASRVALASVMRRRPEAYHSVLTRSSSTSINPHETTRVRHAGLEKALVYDDHERRSALVRLIDRDGHQVGGFVDAPWEIIEATYSSLRARRTADGLTVDKSISVGGGRLDPHLSIVLSVSARSAFSGTLELEMNLNLSGGGANPSAYYRWGGHEARFDSAANVLPGMNLTFGNEHDRVEIEAHAEPGAEASWSSVETVSQSESGFELTHQGSCLVFRWPLELAAGGERSFEVSFAVRESRDLAEEQATPVANHEVVF